MAWSLICSPHGDSFPLTHIVLWPWHKVSYHHTHRCCTSYKYACSGFRTKVNLLTTAQKLVLRWSSTMVTYIWKSTVALLLIATFVGYSQLQVCELWHRSWPKRILHTYIYTYVHTYLSVEQNRCHYLLCITVAI